MYPLLKSVPHWLGFGFASVAFSKIFLKNAIAGFFKTTY
jgi:hypothetical protein